MRITNTMILKNSSYNINGTKTAVNIGNTQMTTQKKIIKPSDDPVTAIRSLRLSTNLSKINQYYKKNIPDAQSWLDVTETALLNMKKIITDVRTQCVKGATDTLTQEDRHTILSQLSALQGQLFAEGNSDYAGRTVFTGYRTNQNLVFTADESDVSYTIDQSFQASEIETFRYYNGVVQLPATQTEVMNNAIANTEQTEYARLRVGYDGIDKVNTLSYTYGGNTVTYDIANAVSVGNYQTANAKDSGGNDITYVDEGGNTQTAKVMIFENQDDWAAAMGDQKIVNDQDLVFIKNTGELIMGNEIASELKSGKAAIDLQYDKTGFDKGELKPEYYYNCVDNTDPVNPVHHQKYDEDGNELGYDIDYTVAANQTLTVNLEASDVFDGSIQRDVSEMITAVSAAIAAHDKIDKIKSMQKETQYADAEYQAKLDEWLEAATKEADYADYNLKKMFSSELGKVDGYLSKISLGVTKLGCTTDQLKLTEARMDNQKETVEALQSQNDDMDLSEVIMKYLASYNAYQSSLTAAGKLGDMTLLNYI